MTLYELTADWEMLLQQIEENQGALTPEMENQLQSLLEATPNKIDNSLDVLANLESMEAAQEGQANRMRLRAQRTGKAANALRERIQGAIKAMGGKHESPRWKATLTTGRPAIAEMVPGTIDKILSTEKHMFRRVEEKITLDKDSLSRLTDEELEEIGLKRERKPFLRIT